jgi:non-ribosomal peptide synthetase component F
MSHQIAIYGGGAALTYQELDRRANHLARYLLAQGAETADRIGLFLEQGSDYYIAMLAILKVQATYVPLDPDSPLDRNSYIAADAGIRMLITRTALTDRLPAHRDPAVTVVLIDALEMDINRHSRTRLPRRFSTHRGGAVAAVIYPAGAAARSGGAEITHSGMFKFALTAARLCAITASDRIYEDLSAAAHSSAEAIWTTWAVGASLLHHTGRSSQRRRALRRFLEANEITVLYCTPQLLDSLGDAPTLRTVVVSGQACPSQLFIRWQRPGRRLISVYGTAETTQPTPAALAVPVRAAAGVVQLDGGGGVTVHMTPSTYRQTSNQHLRQMLLD